MTTIFVENCPESGNLVKIVETFGGHSIQRNLRPGENARISVSRYKSILVEEITLGAGGVEPAEPGRRPSPSDTWPSFLQRRCG